MEHGEREALASRLEDLAALARVSTMVATGPQEIGLAQALGPAVAALGDRLASGEFDVAAVLPMVAGAVDRLRGYVAAEKRSMSDLAQALQLVSGAVAAPAGPAIAPATTVSRPTPVDPGGDLVTAADSYATDALRSARTMIWLYTGGAALAAIALVTHWLLVFTQSPRPAMGDFLVQSLPFLFLLALSAFVFVHANRQRRNTEDLRRVERQLRTLPGYLAPLPANTQALLRSTLMQRLFPRLSDDDLLREPDSFPSADYLMESITDGDDHDEEDD
jgi:hypothetical protein